MYYICTYSSTGAENRTLSVDGLELTMATNHFGHFLLTNLLLPHLQRTSELARAAGAPLPRVVSVSSKAHAPLFPLHPGWPLDLNDLNVCCSHRIL